MTFRCSVIVKGLQCPCDLTVANAYSRSWYTLERRNPSGVTLEAISKGAMCPWHANYLRKAYDGDICKIEYILQKYANEKKKKEGQSFWMQRQRQFDEKMRNVELAEMPALGRAFLFAGVDKKWAERNGRQSASQ